MTPLRQRMLDDMQLRGFSPSTQRCYVQAVQRFAQHFGKSPDQITEEELRQYLGFNPIRPEKLQRTLVRLSFALGGPISYVRGCVQ